MIVTISNPLRWQKDVEVARLLCAPYTLVSIPDYVRFFIKSNLGQFNRVDMLSNFGLFQFLSHRNSVSVVHFLHVVYIYAMYSLAPLASQQTQQHC